MSNPGDYGQNPAGAPQWGAPQQGFNPNQTQGFDPNQTQGHGQGYPQFGAQPQQPGQQPQQQWGAPQGYAQAPAPAKPLPWTLRELILVGIGVLTLVFSFFPLAGAGSYSVNTWEGGGWILGVVVPVIAVALIAIRPFVPVMARIGSLSVDQFASVAFSVAGVQWLSTLMSGMGSAIAWAGWLMMVLAIVGIVVTVVAPFIPGLREEFDQRPEEVAPRAARTTRVIPEGKSLSFATTAPAAFNAPAQQNTWDQQQFTGAVPAFDQNAWAAQAPAAQAPAAQAPAADAPAADAPVIDFGQAPVEEAAVVEDVAADAVVDGANAQQAPVADAAQQPFWALAPDERAIVDEQGNELFRVGPTAWALVIEDRGSSYVVRHDDGRTGTLNDVSGVVRN